MFGTTVAMFIHLTVAIPFVVGIVNYHKFNLSYRIFVWLLVLSFLGETISILTSKLIGRNLFTLHFYTIAEVIILSLFFMQRLNVSLHKRIVQVFMVAFSAFALVYASMGDNLAGFNSLPKGIESIYISALCCFVFYEMSVEPSGKEDNGFYFINGAVLLYFSSNFLVFAFSHLFMEDMKNLLLLHNVKSLVMMTCYISYAVGLWLISRSSSYSSI
jgi:hypothetical protein